MPITRTSRTRTLPTGNRVTVTLGSRRGRHGRLESTKTVTVRRTDGTSDSRTKSSSLVPYTGSVPNWAKGGSGTGPAAAKQGAQGQSSSRSGWKWFFLILAVLFYLFWPLSVDQNTIHGQSHVSAVGVILLCIWLPIAIGVPVLVSQVPRRRALKMAERASREKHIAEMERNLGMDSDAMAGVTGSSSANSAFVTASVAPQLTTATRAIDVVAEIHEARAAVIDALRKLDAAEKHQFQTMSAWPVEPPFLPEQVAEAQRSARRATAEQQELSAILELRTRTLHGLLDQAKASGVEVADDGFTQESAALQRSIHDSGRRIAALAQLYRTDGPREM